jgi:hypothetical protein
MLFNLSQITLGGLADSDKAVSEGGEGVGSCLRDTAQSLTLALSLSIAGDDNKL